ncbi:hypothetical protein BCR37DRAFT_382759 [Protomyces lactucae-debilis]|uniref:Mitochondrial inner membrane protein 1 n=1 Tax=Protomyces lactucae-debilis TaxID=2754530 RepID=A0A1Y2F0C5_PROLT|nr:uncharacterized protein BCR37DRAFT_382759 [Protomyces lactucae-debilis]ORY77299.1 hypothetical protein BCR37DRAFT_382759 [Protomyces lactucae-debilis]
MYRPAMHSLLRARALHARTIRPQSLLLRKVAPAISLQQRLASSDIFKGFNRDEKKVTSTSTTTPITTGTHAEQRSPIVPPEGPATSQLIREIKQVGQAIDGIPIPTLQVGLAGTLPYLGTAIGSLYLSWTAAKWSQDFTGAFSEKFVFFTAEQAEYLLPHLQHIQVGYGACLISFIGAIHWGFEFAGYGGHTGYRRLLYAAVPSLVAWTSIMLPVDYALVTHFLGFTGLWFADSAAARRGFAPAWYIQYRFLLTFIVCSSILLTLIVSGWLGDPAQATAHSSRLENLREEQQKQYIQDENAAAASRKKQSKRQGDSQEDLTEKVKAEQKAEKKDAKRLKGESEEKDVKKANAKDEDAVDGVEAAKNQAGGTNKVTSKDDQDKKATEGKAATASADKKK